MKPKEENKMDLLFCVVLPIAVVLIQYASKKYEEKKQKISYEQQLKKVANDLYALMASKNNQG